MKQHPLLSCRKSTLALLICASALPAFCATAFVRVNQVGYAATAAKRAYLMASASESGATFAVKNSSGTTVYSAPIGAKLGKWSRNYPDVYALDFDSVTTAGAYTIVITGAIPATSPTFSIDTPLDLYSTPIANALYFYENQRDGPNYIPTPLRSAPGHLNDSNANRDVGSRTNVNQPQR